MWYTNWVVILTGESASYLIMRATQKDNLELESMSTEVLLIGRLKNTLVAISQGVMVKILQHIWLLQALKKSYHTMMKNYSEQGRACGSTTMILCSLGQTPGVNYSLLIAIFKKNSKFSIHLHSVWQDLHVQAKIIHKSFKNNNFHLHSWMYQSLLFCFQSF